MSKVNFSKLIKSKIFISCVAIFAILISIFSLFTYLLYNHYYSSLNSKFKDEYDRIYAGKGWQFSTPIETIPCNYFQPNKLEVKVLVEINGNKYSVYNIKFIENSDIYSNNYKLDRYTNGNGSATLDGSKEDIFKVFHDGKCEDFQKTQTLNNVQIHFNPPTSPEEQKAFEESQKITEQFNKEKAEFEAKSPAEQAIIICSRIARLQSRKDMADRGDYSFVAPQDFTSEENIKKAIEDALNRQNQSCADYTAKANASR